MGTASISTAACGANAVRWMVAVMAMRVAHQVGEHADTHRPSRTSRFRVRRRIVAPSRGERRPRWSQTRMREDETGVPRCTRTGTGKADPWTSAEGPIRGACRRSTRPYEHGLIAMPAFGEPFRPALGWSVCAPQPDRDGGQHPAHHPLEESCGEGDSSRRSPIWRSRSSSCTRLMASIRFVRMSAEAGQRGTPSVTFAVHGFRTLGERSTHMRPELDNPANAPTKPYVFLSRRPESPRRRDDRAATTSRNSPVAT